MHKQSTVYLCRHHDATACTLQVVPPGYAVIALGGHNRRACSTLATSMTMQALAVTGPTILLLALQAASGRGGTTDAAAATIMPPRVPAACAAELDKFCANETGPLKLCYHSMKTAHRTTPLLAAFSDTPASVDSPEWRCYSPDDLSPAHATAATSIMQRRYTKGPDYCSTITKELAEMMLACDPSWTPPPKHSPYPGFPTLPLTVFPEGAIPSLAYVPAAAQNGTLLAFAQYQGSLGQRRSSDVRQRSCLPP